MHDAHLPLPPRELAGFAAPELDAGETRPVEVDRDGRAFAVPDESAAVDSCPPSR